MKKTIVALIFTCGIIACSSFIMTLHTNHQKNNDLHQQTAQNTEPCSVSEIITFFDLLSHNATSLNCTLTSKTKKNGMTKIMWSYPEEGYDGNIDYTFYIPQTDNRFYSHKERHYGCDYMLYKNTLHNNNEIVYLLIYNHSGTGNYGGIIGAWTIKDNILIKKDCSCFYTDECPQHIADNFVITHRGKLYLQFIGWEQNEPMIQRYIWENNSLQKVENVIINS